MSRATQMNYASTPRAEAKPKPPSITGFKFVTVPELTSPDGLPTKIYGATLAEARVKAREAIKASGLLYDATPAAHSKREYIKKVQAQTPAFDPRIKIGTRFGEWTVIGEAEYVVNASGTNKTKKVNCRCSCSNELMVAASSLTGNDTSMCRACSQKALADRRRLAAELARSKRLNEKGEFKPVAA